MCKLCITATGKDLDSKVDARFGRCAYILCVDDKGQIVETIQNPNVDGSGAGIATAQIIADKHAKTVITQNVGPKALNALESLGIEVFYASGSVKKVIHDFIQNKINPINKEILHKLREETSQLC